VPKAEVEQLLTTVQVADWLQVKVETLHQWRWQGKGPRAVRSGPKFVRYRAADVNAWIEAQAPPAA
jgi:predicted DNA-binding transcriptional regulator AlpA